MGEHIEEKVHTMLTLYLRESDFLRTQMDNNEARIFVEEILCPVNTNCLSFIFCLNSYSTNGTLAYSLYSLGITKLENLYSAYPQANTIAMIDFTYLKEDLEPTIHDFYSSEFAKYILHIQGEQENFCTQIENFFKSYYLNHFGL